MNTGPAATPTPDDRRGLALAAALTIASFAVYLWKTASGFVITEDWDYFNALSLVVRSNIWSYGRFPLHDPWVCGGLDLTANPQNRLFSPLSLLDIVFSPAWANLLSVIAHAVLGLWGTWALLRHLGVRRTAALTGALWFVNLGWFSLHWAEGHISYGSLQLSPWVFLFCLRVDEERARLLLAALWAIILQDGGIYAFLFTLLLVPCSFILRPGLARKKIAVRPLPALLTILVFALLALPKLLPVLLSIGARKPDLVRVDMDIPFLLKTLFWPFQTLTTAVPTGHQFRFQEYSGYLGLPAAGLLAWAALRRPGFARQNAGWLALALFWLWVATGWGGELNPWRLFERIPLVNNARIPSRMTLFMLLFLLVPLARALDALPRRTALVLGAVIVLEGLFIRSWSAWHAYRDFGKPSDSVELIRNTTIEETVLYGPKPRHYYTNRGAVLSYEPAHVRTEAAFNGFKDYRGEAYYLEGAGEARITSFTPGRLSVKFRGSPGALVRVNTNRLFGWRVAEGPAEITTSVSGLLTFRTLEAEGTAELRYAPWTLPLILALCAAGWALFGLLLIRL